jgi:hypothetical protein
LIACRLHVIADYNFGLGDTILVTYRGKKLPWKFQLSLTMEKASPAERNFCCRIGIAIRQTRFGRINSRVAGKQTDGNTKSKTP